MRLDEYFVDLFEKQKEEISAKDEEIKKLKNEIKKLKNPAGTLDEDNSDKIKTYVVNEQPYYYYVCRFVSTYDYNKALLQNGLTPDFLQEILDGKRSLDDWMFLNYKDSWSTNQITDVKRETYDFLITNFYGRKAVVYSDYSKNINIRNVDKDESTYLNAEEAEAYATSETLNRIKEYFNYYSKKFEEEKERYEAKQEKKE